jgi:catechol 2,3-dioxygenase-like lactoylglutathione lyase family enzyme
MLGNRDLIAFAATADAERAKAFYASILGLRLTEDTPFALVFDAAGTPLRVAKVAEVVPAPYTLLGWSVPDMGEAVRALARKGVVFERYAGMPQDERGVWTTPDGARVAWFKDPDGNVLSLTQFAPRREAGNA